MTETLQEEGFLIQAARISDRFKLDPVEVLRASAFEWSVRSAAYMVIAKDEEENAERMRSKSKKK